VELVLGNIEGSGDAAAATGGFGRQLELLRPRLLEQHRLIGALDDRAKPGQRHRLLVHLDLAHLHQSVDEAAKTKFLGVGLVLAALSSGHEVTPQKRRRAPAPAGSAGGSANHYSHRMFEGQITVPLRRWPSPR